MGCLYSKGCFGKVPKSPEENRDKDTRLKSVVVDSGFSANSSSDDDDGDNDELQPFNMTRESDAGIRKLRRVSSQFLPPEGSRTIRVPLGNYDLKYSFLTQRGYYPDALDKANQDSFCIYTPFGTSPDDHFFAVFDGHGEYGAECSQFAKRKLCENLLRNSRFQADAVEACHAAFSLTNSQLHYDSLDDTMSGTTAITVLVRGRTIYVANAGDSRAVIAERKGEEILAVDLSIDQTPFRKDELERVKNCGARVMTLDQIEGLKNPDEQCWDTEEADDGDPPRLWLKNGMLPGTAFTRSIGDSIAESIGVVATPEIYVLELTPNHPFFVIASDGVFEFMTSQCVVDMVSKFKDPRDACAAVVAESYRLWLQYETRTDDITVIVVHINGIANIESVQEDFPIFPSRPLQQIVEVTGTESPSMLKENSKNYRVRHDLSKARLREIESSLENGQSWVPPSPAHRKTWEEEAHIEQVLQDHFLFRKLTESQRQVLLDCMLRVEFKEGDVVVQQGGDGDCFYVVGSGEFEVLATQEEEGKGMMTKVLHRYTAESMSSFGELALMHNKPLQASVRAVTRGTLWTLRREDFRGILMSEFSNLSSLRLLRSVDLFSRLSILQLSHIAESLVEVSFSDGQTIIDENEGLSALYIIQKGQVRLTYKDRLTEQEDNDHVVTEGSHFGESALFGEHVKSVSAVAIGDVLCAIMTKEVFDSVIGPITKLLPEDRKLKESLVSSKDLKIQDDISTCTKEWKMGIYATDCSEIGLVLLRGSDVVRSLRRFSKKKIREFSKEAQVLKERDLVKSLNPSVCFPQVLCTCANEQYVGILLNCCLTCPLASILRSPLDEYSAKFFAASVVVALEQLQRESILYRGISPDVLLLDRTGHLQFVDFRFAKKLAGERTYTICGIADSLAPEIVLGRGHGFAADWWALGVLIYYMLQAEMPFGSWRESETDTAAKIAKGQLSLPHAFTSEATDLITKLLEVDESARLGTHGAESIKRHSWFSDIDWKEISDGTFPVPLEVISRVDTFLENYVEDITVSSQYEDSNELNSQEWLEDW